MTGTSGTTYTASAQVTTYRRPNGYSYGYISRGDRVTILGTYGNYTQVKYPVSNGHKYGFITTESANAYIIHTIIQIMKNGQLQVLAMDIIELKTLTLESIWM